MVLFYGLVFFRCPPGNLSADALWSIMYYWMAYSY